MLPNGDYAVTTKRIGKAVWSESELLIHKCYFESESIFGYFERATEKCEAGVWY